MVNVTLICAWVRGRKYVRVSDIQKELEVGFIDATKYVQYLIETKMIEERFTGRKGHKVINVEPLPLVRFVHGNWKTKETYFLSEPTTLQKVLEIYRDKVPTLPEKGKGTELMKFMQDQGPDFDYMRPNPKEGFLIFTHREKVPF